MRLFKRITILILILLLSLYWMPTALAVGETSPYTTNTEDDRTEDEKEETDDEKEPEIVEKPVYIYIENSTIDYSALNRQIAIANGLRESDYTKESWAVLEAALDTAIYAQDSSKQDVVDKATEALKVAISELVSMDYTMLEQAVIIAKSYIDSEEYGFVITLSNLILKAEQLLQSGDQEAVNACVDEINRVVTQYVASLPEVEEPKVVVKEVKVEVPPSTDYCNISKHYLWPILFFISLGVNLLLAVTIVFIVRRRKLLGADVPLVDYDIDDDI